jgi:Xaa-Pro aminopeptidase
MRMTTRSVLAGLVALLVAVPAAAQPAEAPPPATPKPVKKKPRKVPRGTAPIDPYAGGPAAPAPGTADPLDPYAPAGDPAKADPAKAETVDPYGEPIKEQVPTVRGDAVTSPARTGLDLTAVQGMLAVQRLDGWLLFDRDGLNPIARALVKPEGRPERSWFYLLPASGTEPTLLCHASDAASFKNVPGKKLTYGGYRDLDKSLRALVKGKRTLAMEYAGKGGVPSQSRVDAGTLERIRAIGVTVKSSASLVQFTKSVWGEAGRKTHAVAVHHLTELRKDALGFIAKQVAAGQAVTERDVQLRLLKGMAMRGLVGPAPVVATGANTSDPRYLPSATRSAAIVKGDLVILSLAGRLDQDGAIYAASTWVAYVGDLVPERMIKAFDIVVLARDQAIALVSDRGKRRRAVQGFEVDAAARAFIEKAGYGDQFVHRTGHSIDSDLYGGGADLDDLEIKDTRALAIGSGFTVGPGVYAAGDFGVRTEVCAYFGPDGVEVTTPVQDQIEKLLAP